MVEEKEKEDNLEKSNNQNQAGNNNQGQKEAEKDEVNKIEIEKKLKELEQEVSEEDTQFASLEDELVKAKEEIDELHEKKDRYQSRLKRLKADFSNYKRRQREQKDKLVLRTKKDLLKELVPVIDNFERAIDSSSDDAENTDDLLEGINMIYKQLNQFLEQEDVKKLGQEGEEFDPNCHNAVTREESEEYEADEIIEVLQTGYQIEDEIIRPAMVKIAE